METCHVRPSFKNPDKIQTLQKMHKENPKHDIFPPQFAINTELSLVIFKFAGVNTMC